MDYKKPLKSVALVPHSPIVKYPILLGALILISFLSIFIIWSIAFPLDKAAIAQGQIVVDSNRKTIQHFEGGIIKKILVTDGQFVTANEPLIILDDTQAKADAVIAYNEYLELITKEARLLAEKNETKIINFPKVLLKEVENNTKITDMIKAQQAIFDDNNESYKKSIDSLNEKIVFLNAQVTNLSDQVQAEVDRLTYAEKELIAANKLAEKNYVGKAEIWKLNQAALSVKSSINEHKAEISEAKQEITQAQLQIITETNDRRKEILEELQKTQRELAIALQQYKAKKDIQNRPIIRTPINGTVVNLQYHTIGGVIRSGEMIMEIIPKNDILIIKARLNPRDIDMIHKGLSAKVQLTAYLSRRTPMVKGIVSEVSADVLQDSKTQEYYYEIKVIIDEEQLKKLRNVSLYPGMPAQVSIIVDQRSLFDYILTPIMTSFDRAFKEE